jgi:hypothetical protein
MVLSRLGEMTAARAGDLDAALARAADEPGHSPTPGDALADVAATARKALGGCQQRLAALEIAADADDRERLESVRSLLSAAAEDEIWACRMIETATYGDNPGLQRAVGELREHAAQCREEAVRLIA